MNLKQIKNFILYKIKLSSTFLYKMIRNSTREDGLTIEAYGDKCWYKNNVYHREDGPACEWTDGTKEWWINGKPHREDGPAYEGADGRQAWFINGKQIE
jgi:hypothetical protein